jgi:hypothetical protein
VLKAWKTGIRGQGLGVLELLAPDLESLTTELPILALFLQKLPESLLAVAKI